MLPYQSPSRVVDSTAGRSPACFSRTSSFCVHRRTTISSRAYSTTSRELDRERDGRRDHDLDPCTKLGADLDTIRAAFVRTIWTQTRGVSDPARRACTDPDAREAGSLTPLSASIPLFCGRPGRHKAPADTDADSGANIGSCEASQPTACAATIDLAAPSAPSRSRGGRWPAGHCSPSSAPLLSRPSCEKRPGEERRRL